MTVIHVLAGPRCVLKTDTETRWCFGCRKRLPHEWRLLDYDADSPHYGWYPPIWACRCTACGEDRTRFGS